MEVQPMKTLPNAKPLNWLSRLLFKGLILVVLIIVVFVIVFEYSFISKPSLLGITPGRTTLETAWGKLSEPENIEFHGDIQILSYYAAAENIGWRELELWALKDDTDWVVQVIYREIPLSRVSEDAKIEVEFTTLADLLTQYGGPSYVTWGSGCFFRFLVWDDAGIAAMAGYQPDKGPNEQIVISLLLFERNKSDEMMSVNWPLVPWRSESTCGTPTHKPDIYPEDPYPWELWTNSIEN